MRTSASTRSRRHARHQRRQRRQQLPADLRRRQPSKSGRPITVTADPQSKVYGDADPALTYQVSAGTLAFADTFTGALGRAAGENVGVYAITQGTLAINDGNGGNNYKLTFVPDDFEIRTRPITVTATRQSKVYGDADPVFAYTVSGGTLRAGDNFTGALGRAAGENIGVYALTRDSLAISDGNGGNNYQLTFVPDDFEIRTRPITVTATRQFKVYGDADPVFAYTVSAGTLRAGDSFTGALGRAAGENIGVYALTRDTLPSATATAATTTS